MKFKNSYILLIVMAIFLLVSIGSVCASENVTADSDNQIDSADTSVVLTSNSTDGGDSAQEKINTTIVTENIECEDGESAVIPVKVNDVDNNTIDVDESGLSVLEDGSSIKFTYNSTTGITISDSLSIGNHTLDIWYLGNDTYNNSTAQMILSIFGDNELDIPSNVYADGSSVEVPITLSDGVHDNTGLLNDSNTVVTLQYDGGNETIIIDWTDVGTSHVINIDDLTGKLPATLTVNYTEGNKSSVKNVLIKVTTSVNASDMDASENKTVEIPVTVLDNDNNPISNISSENLTVTGADSFTYNSTTNVMTIPGLTKGIHNITIAYKGNELYGASTKEIAISVRGNTTINVNTTSVNVNSTKKGEVIITNITDGVECFNFTKDDLNITVTYKDGNDTLNATIKSLTVENGTISFELEDADFTTATMTIVYDNTAVANVTVNRVYNMNITVETTSADFQEGNFTFKVIDIDTNSPLANKNVTVSISKNGTSCYFITKNGNSYSLGTTKTITTDENGVGTLENANFYPGLVLSDNIYAPAGDDYVMKISGSGVTKGSASANITINTIDVKMVLTAFSEYYGTSKKVTITVTNADTGKAISGVYLYLNITGATLSSPRQITDENGTIQLGVSSLPTGTYKMTFKSNDTNLNNASSSGSFTLKKIPVVINGNNVKIYFNTGTTYTIKVTKDGKGVDGVYVFVRLYTTSKKYNDYLFQTNSKGQVSFSASLAVGSHKIIVTLADTRYSASQITKTIKVIKATAKIKAPKVTAYYKGGKYFTIKLINKKNSKPIYDANVNIKIFVTSTKYYNYNGHTGTNGKIKLSLDSLKPGKYKVVVSGASSKNYTAKKVTSKIVIKKAPTKLIPKKLTAKKGKKTYFKVTVKNKKTKKVIAKVKIKVKVYTGKKYKTYTLKTNSKGIAKLNVKKLKVGKHKVVVTSANKYCVAKKATSTIKIKK